MDSTTNIRFGIAIFIAGVLLWLFDAGLATASLLLCRIFTRT